MTSVLPHSRVDASDSNVDNRELDSGDASVEVSGHDGSIDTDGSIHTEGSIDTDGSIDTVSSIDVGLADPPIADPPINVKAEPQLTERQRTVIVFERQWWRHAGSKEQAIREQFGLSATRYYQMLNQLLDLPEALAFDPLVVGRLRRLRATRARTRTAR